MKPIRWIIGLAIAAIVLCAAYFIVDKNASDKEKKEQIGNAKSLFSFDGTQITKVTLDNDDGYFAFEWDAENGAWVLTSAEQFNLNTYVVATICNYFCSLNTEKTVAFDCQETELYGFDHPVTVKVFTTERGEENPYVLYVGDSTPTFNAYYAMVPDSNDVYTIGYTEGSVFCSAKDMLKNLYLFDTYSTQVTDFEMFRGDVLTIALERNKDYTWIMTKPKPFAINHASVTDLMDVLVRVMIQGFVEENPTDLAKYGLAEPAYRIKVKGLSPAGHPMESEIWFGDMISDAADETQMYGYFTESKQVFRVNRAEVSFLENETFDYVLSYCADIEIKDVSKLNVNLGDLYDMDTTLTVDYANEQYSIDGIDIDALKDDDIMTLYQDFYRAITDLRISAIDLNAVPSGESAAEIIYTHPDGTETHLTFIPQASNNFYLMVNGQYSYFTVRLNRFTGSTGLVKAYEALMYALESKQK